MYEVETENIYDNFSKSKEMFEAKYDNDSNALVVGKMKDKMGDAAVEEFVGWKSKVYSILKRDLKKQSCESKCFLSYFDDKIYVIDNEIYALALDT